MTQLIKLPIHRSLTRPQLTMGGERVPMLLLILTCVTLVMVGMNMATNLLAVALYVTLSVLFVNMAKADPQMFKTYTKHIGYPNKMTARSTPWASHKKITKWG